MAFQQAQILKVENGYIVGVTQLEFTEQGYRPKQEQYIAENLDKAIEIVKKA